jgi:predicted GIY-YIG superfamily endonuclease
MTQPDFYVYAIDCLPTGKRYIGYTGSWANRVRNHKSSPPKPMADAVRAHKPYEQHFTYTILDTAHTVRGAKLAEAAQIKMHRLRGAELYNTLDSTPEWDKKFWGMHHGNKQRAAKRKRDRE